jgi:hypothetical protein
MIRFLVATSECFLGELGRAQSLNERGRELAEEHQLWKIGAILNLQAGWMAIARGEGAAGMAVMREQTDVLQQHRGASSYPLVGLYYIDGCRMMGDVGEGFAALQMIRGECERRGIHWFDAELIRLEAELMMLRAAPAASVASLLRNAVDLAARQGAALLALRAALSLHRLVPRDPNAHRLLADAHARVREGTATTLMEDAATLLHA